MGLFDEYAGVQMKVGEGDSMDVYAIGDSVPISDGVYVGWEGVVVVHRGRLVCEFVGLTTKWGRTVPADDALRLIEAQAPHSGSGSQVSGGRG